MWRLGPKLPLQKYWQIQIWQFGKVSPYVYIKYEILTDFNLAVAKADRLVAKLIPTKFSDYTVC